jgi:hypothetical protein
MAEYGVYGQVYGAFAAVGYDTENGFTISVGVQGAIANIAAAASVSYSEVGYQGGSKYTGMATSTGAIMKTAPVGSGLVLAS